MKPVCRRQIVNRRHKILKGQAIARLEISLQGGSGQPPHFIYLKTGSFNTCKTIVIYTAYILEPIGFCVLCAFRTDGSWPSDWTFDTAASGWRTCPWEDNGVRGSLLASSTWSISFIYNIIRPFSQSFFLQRWAAKQRIIAHKPEHPTAGCIATFHNYVCYINIGVL